MRKSKVEAAVPRKVWRITQDAPQGEFVEFVDSKGERPAAPAEARPADAPKILTGPPPPNWRASSYDLLTGLEVQDFSDTLTSDVFDELFPSGDSAWDQTMVLEGPAKKA